MATTESAPPLADNAMASSSTTTTTVSPSPSFLGLIAAPLAELPWHEHVGAQPLPRAWAPRPQSIATPQPRVPVDEMTKEQLHMHTIKEKYWRDVHNGRREHVAPKKKRVKPERVQLTDWTQSDQSVLMGAKQAIFADYARCPCVQCTILRREGQPAVEFRCSVRSCTTRFFTDFVAFFEHQVRAHGKLHPQCRRVRMELFGQDSGVVPYPPVTVYVGQQVLHPAYRPTEWTLERVELEMKTLSGKLFHKERSQTVQGAVHVWDSFLMAYHQLRGGGLAQLRAQHAMALEYYESALVNPVGTRTFQDGADIVGNERNWLAMSPELERAEYTTPFRYEHEKKDDPFRGFNSDNDGDSDDDNEEEDSETLLFESGEPVVFNATVAATIAERRRVFVTKAHTKRKRLYEDAARCNICHREGHRSDKCPERELRAVKKPRKKYQCSVCKQEGHQKRTCPEDPEEIRKKLFLQTQEVPGYRCSKCGLMGHMILQCLQPSDEALDPRIS